MQPQRQSQEIYDEIDMGYYDAAFRKNKGIQSKWHHLKFKGVRQVLDTLSYDKLLDYACGPGTFISTLPQDKTCWGMDMAQKQIDYANTRYKTNTHQFQVASAFKIPFEDNFFDIVTAIEFIEHLSDEDIPKFLSEAYRCLTPNGHILITTPNYEWLWRVLEYLLTKYSKNDYNEQHLTHFLKNTLKSTMEQAGFQTVLLKKYLYLAAFVAPINWNLADAWFRVESKYLPNGNLLLYLGKKA